MTVRLLITSTVAVVLAGPAFADCMQEIQSLSETVTQARPARAAPILDCQRRRIRKRCSPEANRATLPRRWRK